MHKPFRYQFAGYLANKIERRAEQQIKRHAVLCGYLEHYRRTSPSPGCSYADYSLLYRYVKNHKPREVLECGTGFSTVVILQALRENEEEYGIKGRLVSMEENRDYYEAAVKSLPPPN